MFPAPSHARHAAPSRGRPRATAAEPDQGGAEPTDHPADPAAGAPQRTAAIPAVLLVAAGMAFAGLAVPSSAAPPETLLVATAAGTSSVLDLGVATAAKPLARLDGPLAPAPAAAAGAAKPAPRAPAAEQRASRSRSRAAAAPVRKKKPSRKVSARYVRPNGGGVSSPYGMRWGRLHKGVDFNGSYGSAIYAVTAGRVISAGYDGGYGNLVQVRHADGTVTAYAHMSRILVRGGSVSAGQVIGLVGSTGNSTGPHLHFEVRLGGGQTNPLPWLRRHGVRV